MKLAVSSLKTIDYKELAINHGEKVVIAIVALMIGLLLYGTNWKATDKSPSELTDKAKKVQQEIEGQAWPASKQTELTQGNDLGAKVAQLLTPVSALSFGIQPLNPPLHPDKTLITMPKWLAVNDLIAEYGVADIRMKEGVPALDDGFLDQKKKESKSKARAKRREQNAAKKEGKEKEKENETADDDSSIPEALRRKAGGPGGGPGQMGGKFSVGGNGMRGSKRESKRQDLAAEAAAAATAAATARAAATKPTGRGYRFVAVRGVFPLKNQVNELARAMGLATSQKDLLGLVQFKDFKLERQTRIEKQGAESWGPWELVDRDPVIQLLENDIAGYAPETVLYGLLDAHICMPYPERIVGQWGLLASHPDIKEFNLSDEEVEQQVEMEWKLLEKVAKENQKNKTPDDKRGFMSVQQNLRALNNRPQAAAVAAGGDDRSIREKVLEDLESGKAVDREKMDEQLQEFVRTRATPVDHFVLFRYLDLKVEAGNTYRYRVKLVVANPFHDKHVEEVTDPSIIENEERETEYSEPTQPVTVKEDGQFFVKRVDSHVGRPSLPSAAMDLFQWFASTGTVVNRELTIQIGQLVGGRKKADVLNPAAEVFDTKNVLFSTNDALVDVTSRMSLDSTLHKEIVDGLNAVAAKKVDTSAPDEALVVNRFGELRMLDGLDQKPDYDQTKQNFDYQNKPFENLKKSAADDDSNSRRGLFGKGGGGVGGNKKAGKGDPRRAARRMDKGK